MIRDIFMPALSSTMTEGKIVSWAKSQGEKVEKGETVLVVESDKADMDVESFHDGYLATILVPEGEQAPVGSTIGLLAETEAEIETAKQQGSNQTTATTAKTETKTETPVAPSSTPEPATPTPQVASTPTSTPKQENGRVVASPRARKLAKEHNIDLATLQGSGPHGRIVASDVEAATGQPTATPQPQPTPQPAPQPTPQAAPSYAKGEVVPFTTLQSSVVRNMTATVQVPTFHVGYTITTDALDKLYKQIKSKGVTMTALLAKAVAATLQKHPLVNASYSEQGIQYHSGINIAVAVAMEDGGLITPVLRNAAEQDIYTLSRNWKDLVKRSRSKQLQPEEYSTGTFTLSNLGMFGVDRFDAILPPGQGGILAIGASRPQVVATDDGMFGVRRQMSVNITCDHRIIYGAHAAAFLQDLAQLIETDPQSLTL
ncbi:dihydrolipoamide acetyltransferase family protein [Dactylococcopsis salina]|uniref:Dihydrolipoamide acetyltransferase component of pyruvate dehydrogenase complex n=1 Tax=Dactylococcopsis salina (strain PCC 8305) TaxID=13035 RepID=K9YVH9_DACS8|nr:dihydrolipoamide acetyltransferase family protein [Dactylococcopsis salina]AFZ50931.1 pyruvate/2-oxoglutarate dehydrogenase complex, dihydrolipoamide acyltransferase component [Dactylococcopsis salina PCC 8305]